MINELSKQIHENNQAKGFYDEPKNIAEMLCLIHAEVSEALEIDRAGNFMLRPKLVINDLLKREDDETFAIGYRMGIKGSFEEEMADIMIRVMDLCRFRRIDIESHILLKMRYNKTRPHKHGKKY